ncbi:type I DNA topoisomerase ['Camptotheca acuminata' phytoplasma]|uniref:type I DNA topoisomerase n=1 Tax='Camptotheca acuminata' phytoplasma TaxID=3239192 RepID=UPI00351A833C
MENVVIILESPAKAKTISNYLGKDFLVLCSKGHVRDLSLKGKDRLGIDISNDFQPYYQIIDKQEKLVKDLFQKTRNKKVFLATDPDREGEAIAWHLSQVLKLDRKEKNRILFNEITKNVVKEALKYPSVIRESLVESQETRRILDRIIGFKLSYLVKKIKAQSAGRVQSVALKLIVELEEEIKKFVPEEYNLIKAYFKDFQADLLIKPSSYKMKTEETQKIFDQIKDRPFFLKEIQDKKIKKYSPRPFITSTLQQEAFKKLFMKSKDTMSVAQKLYEGIDVEGQRTGLITYMRTDSFRMSSEFIQQSRIFIQENYGEKYLGVIKEYKKINNIGDAHEAIRVTDINRTPQKLSNFLNKKELSLYNLIYERTLTSLMSEAILNQKQIFFEVEEHIFLSEGLEMVFDGFYKGLSNQFKDKLLPSLELHQSYMPEKIEIINKMTHPPSRFTEASLIKKLEMLKIGRPSTYSSIIEILKKRFYVTIENFKFVCTQIGFETNKLLEDYFSSIINVNYTSEMEKQLDNIASGKNNKLNILKEFYDPFQKLFEKANKETKKKEPVMTQIKCDLCGKFLVERKGRYGTFLGCSGFPKCKKTVQKLEPFEQVNKETKKQEPVMTQIKCDLCGKFLVERKGRYGTFLGCIGFPKCKKIQSLNKKNN